MKNMNRKMTREEYEDRVKEALYACRGTPRSEIDAEIEKERDWFFSYYENAEGNYERAVYLAIANFSMWV